MPTNYPTSTRADRQRGLTLISWVVVIAFIGFQVVLAMNVVPVYINDNSVRSVMEALETDPAARKMSTKKLKLMLIKRLKINNIYSIKSDNIVIKKSKTGRTINIVYEPRGTLVGNLDYIVTFKHEAVIAE